MSKIKLTHKDLEPDLRRVGITWQVFDVLMRENRREQSSADSVGLALDLNRTAEVLKSLPDGAGEAAFIEAWKAQVATPWIAKAKRAAELARKKAQDEQAGA